MTVDGLSSRCYVSGKGLTETLSFGFCTVCSCIHGDEIIRKNSCISGFTVDNSIELGDYFQRSKFQPHPDFDPSPFPPCILTVYFPPVSISSMHNSAEAVLPKKKNSKKEKTNK